MIDVISKTCLLFWLFFFYFRRNHVFNKQNFNIGFDFEPFFRSNTNVMKLFFWTLIAFDAVWCVCCSKCQPTKIVSGNATEWVCNAILTFEPFASCFVLSLSFFVHRFFVYLNIANTCKQLRTSFVYRVDCLLLISFGVSWFEQCYRLTIITTANMYNQYIARHQRISNKILGLNAFSCCHHSNLKETGLSNVATGLLCTNSNELPLSLSLLSNESNLEFMVVMLMYIDLRF